MDWASPPNAPQGAAQRLHHLLAANHGTHRGLVRSMLAEAEYLTGRLDPWVRLPDWPVQRLVFVCLGNINRSAFAEHAARALGAHACSLGLSTTTGAPAFSMAQSTAREFGIDLGPHRATALGDHERRPGELLLAMEVRHARRLRAAGFADGSVVLLGHWAAPRRLHLHDPHTLSEAYFRTCFTLLDSAVRGLVSNLRRQGHPCIRA